VREFGQRRKSEAVLNRGSVVKGDLDRLRPHRERQDWVVADLGRRLARQIAQILEELGVLDEDVHVKPEADVIVGLENDTLGDRVVLVKLEPRGHLGRRG
jgi:hypothetical protein